MKNDRELKDYLNELSAKGYIPFGGRYGNVSLEHSALFFFPVARENETSFSLACG